MIEHRPTQGERRAETVTCQTCKASIPLTVPDPFCFDCGIRHYRDQHPFPSDVAADVSWGAVPRYVRTPLLGELEGKLRALPTRHFNNHTGEWVERAAVMKLLDPRKVEAA